MDTTTQVPPIADTQVPPITDQIAINCSSGMALYQTGPGSSFKQSLQDMENAHPWYGKVKYSSEPSLLMGGLDYINGITVGVVDSSYILVTCRGTFTTFSDFDDTIRSLLDWRQDLMMETVQLPGAPNGVMVHRGFHDAVTNANTEDGKGVIEVVQNALKANPGLPVRLTGHSKGAAMPYILAALLHQSKITPASIVTMAAPRPGNAAFATYVQEFMNGNIQRIEVTEDIVPHVPPTTVASIPFEAILQAIAGLITNPTEKKRIEDIISNIASVADANYSAVGQLYYFADGAKSPQTPVGTIKEAELAAKRLEAIASLLASKGSEGVKQIIGDHSLQYSYGPTLVPNDLNLFPGPKIGLRSGF